MNDYYKHESTPNCGIEECTLVSEIEGENCCLENTKCRGICGSGASLSTISFALKNTTGMDFKQINGPIAETKLAGLLESGTPVARINIAQGGGHINIITGCNENIHQQNIQL